MAALTFLGVSKKK